MKVPEDVLIECCIRGDLVQLRRWAQQGLRCVCVEPLIQATLAGKLEVVRYLVIELGADVNQAGEDGCTALYIAARKGHESLVRFIIKELGVDVNQADERGWTALHAAAQCGHESLVRSMVKELGADVNQTDMMGVTPLFIAAHDGHESVVRCMVKELGADVNQADMMGATPLFIAAQYGHESLVRCMVKELGADVNKSMHDGRTPLMVAAHNKHDKIVAFLLKYGADAQASASEFGTAADVSKGSGAPAKQTAYLEARTHCANTGCSGAGLKKCAGCLVVFYCGRPCQLAHWSAHKAECKETMLRAARGK
jgi:ankyrin repeat protein